DAAQGRPGPDRAVRRRLLPLLPGHGAPLASGTRRLGDLARASSARRPSGLGVDASEGSRPRPLDAAAPHVRGPPPRLRAHPWARPSPTPRALLAGRAAPLPAPLPAHPSA